ncbi:MAG: hypothetical protein ABI311_11005 [Gemmatimonadaceae bacterium]
MTDRKYSEDEVAAIFRAATEHSESGALTGERSGGLTLADLHSIAREVGIPSEAVTRAAQSLSNGTPTTAQTFLGIPVSVARTVNLDRNLTDAEWELLVVQLRQVFRARGTIRVQGSLRQWSNGNLHALLEPTAAGYQLRLGTSKGDVRASVLVGGMALAMAGFVGLMAGLHGTVRDVLPGVLALTGGGALFLGNSVLRVPKWARLRQKQMDDIAENLLRTTRDANQRVIE